MVPKAERSAVEVGVLHHYFIDTTESGFVLEHTHIISSFPNGRQELCREFYPCDIKIPPGRTNVTSYLSTRQWSWPYINCHFSSYIILRIAFTPTTSFVNPVCFCVRRVILFLNKRKSDRLIEVECLILITQSVIVYKYNFDQVKELS